MSNSIVNLAAVFDSSSLISRQAARELFEKISKLDENEIILDFASIDFASRSFFDELNSKIGHLRLLGKTIKFINQSESLNRLFELVNKSAKTKSSFPYASVANVETANF